MYNHDKKNCDCEVCRGISEGLSKADALERLKILEAEKLSQYGWIIHAVGDPNSPTKVNIHTHGLPENFDHLDLQILIPLEKEMIELFLSMLVKRIKEGEKFSDGIYIENIIENYSLKAVSATENGRAVIRIIFPDQTGNNDSWSMQEPYVRQYEDLVDLPKLKVKKQKNTGWVPYKG